LQSFLKWIHAGQEVEQIMAAKKIASRADKIRARLVKLGLNENNIVIAVS
jgi:tRNA threonylcarbamoyladenosine modification (KEOPS) complex  Pcc1 subunit